MYKIKREINAFDTHQYPIACTIATMQHVRCVGGLTKTHGIKIRFIPQTVVFAATCPTVKYRVRALSQITQAFLYFVEL